jgi:hypothetical protein
MESPKTGQSTIMARMKVAEKNWRTPRDSQSLQTKEICTFSTSFPTLFPTFEIRLRIPIRPTFSNDSGI